jgi:hypothetical protein
MRIECRNVGVLRIKAGINHDHCKKFLQTHHSHIPIGARALKFILVTIRKTSYKLFSQIFLNELLAPNI